MPKCLVRKIFTCVSVTFAICIFTVGFIPIKVPSDLFSDVQVCLNENCEPVVTKVVYMVVDALRSDFLYGEKSCPDSWPYLCSLMHSSRAQYSPEVTRIFLRSRVHPPTVTLPRIKALMTGDIPGFVDVLLNYNSSELITDSLLHQMQNANKSMVFYGDDTWMKLFPNHFKRSDGTTSFYVADYTEVDNNVTRHLNSEMLANDWSVMFLHYLGLDHIGHLIGPFSSLVQPKLREMDAIIEKIHKHFINQDSRTLVLLTGDHGMADQGGHGGVTPNEVSTPIVILDSQVSPSAAVVDLLDEVYQIDLIPTLSSLLGLPIPANNLGVTIPIVLENLVGPQAVLQALLANGRQLVRLLSLTDSRFNETSLHQRFTLLSAQSLQTDVSYPERFTKLRAKLTELLNDMRQVRASQLVEYDVTSMALGFLLLAVESITLAIETFYTPPLTQSTNVMLLVILLAIMSSVTQVHCTSSTASPNLCGSTWSMAVLVVVGVGSAYKLVCSLGLIQQPTRNTHRDSMETTTKKRCGAMIYITTLLVHSLSFLSSSFIEEEHQTVYFISMSLIGIIFIASFQLGSTLNNCSARISVVLMAFIMLLLRRWNQTGDKWAHLPDVADTLNSPEYSWMRTLLISPSHVLNLVVLYLKGRQQPNARGFRLTILISTVGVFFSCIFHLQDCSSYFYLSDRGVLEAQAVYFTVLLLFVLSLYYKSLHGFLSAWATLTLLLHRPVNVPVFSGIMIIEHMLSTMVEYGVYERGKPTSALANGFVQMVIYYWLSLSAYFYQGNSNSMSTIDVSAGYKGLRGFNHVITGSLLACHTYSGLIYMLIAASYFRATHTWTGLRRLRAGKSGSSGHIDMGSSFLLYKLFDLTILTLLIIIERYHLFVWTVFAPKLLYEISIVSIFLIFHIFHSIQ